MKIAVFGLGYVGTVCAACLADLGHDVVGVDVALDKVALLGSGVSPVVEEGLDALVRRGVEAGRLRTTKDPAEAVGDADLAFICVGTPSLANGGQDRQYVRRVAADIGRGLRGRTKYCGVVMRSTVLPGTTEDLVFPAVHEAAEGAPLGVASNPEFLREGTAVEDFFNPPYTVVGSADEKITQMLRELYKDIDAPIMVVDTRVAEMLKFVSNTFHALKVAFANEVGSVCKALGVDTDAVIDLFVRDKKLNISDKYLRPGFAFGGSCLPKDVRALAYMGRSNDLDLPLLSNVMRSNEVHIERAIRMVEQAGSKSVGILGIAFKAGTDDLRESPVVTLCETLIGRGYDIRICDPSVNVGVLTGSNRRFIEEQVPHLARLMLEQPLAVVEQSETVILGYDLPAFSEALAARPARTKVIDLTGSGRDDAEQGYLGIIR